MAENGLNLVICLLIFHTGCGIPLPGLEIPVMTPENTKIPYQNKQLEGGEMLPQIATKAPPPRPSESTAISQHTDITSLLQHMSAIEFLRLLALGTSSTVNRETLQQALYGENKVGPKDTGSGQSAVAQPVRQTGQIVRPGQPTGQQQQTHQSANQQPQTGPSANGQAQTGNIGSASTLSSQGGKNQGYMGVQTPNQVPNGQYYSLSNQQRPTSISNGQPSGASMTPNGMAAQPPKGQTMLGIGMGTGYQPNTFNHAQQYTNPAVMLTGGMAPRTNENGPSTGGEKDKAPEVQQPVMTGHAVFNPDQLMNSLLSSDASSFNPDKFTASQSYVSTNSWSSPYAGKPTGYSGMFLKEDKSKQNSGPTGGQKPKQELHGMQQQMSQTQYNAKMNFVPTNMMLPGGAQIDSSDLKFSFDPDKINQFFGTFRPGQIAPSVNGPKAESSERNEEKSDKPKDDKENEESHDDKEAKSEQKSGAHAQQEQTQSHQSQIMPFNTNQGSFAQLDPLPKYFMGNFGGSNPFYFHNNDEQVSQEPEYESFEFVPGRMVPSRQKRSGKEEGRSKKISAENVMRALMANMKFFEKFFRHDVANQEQVEEKKSQVPVNRDSRQNLTIVNSTMTTVQPTTTTAQVTTTLPSSTTIMVITNVTSTNNTSTKIKVNPTKQQSSSNGGFNPDAVNAGQAQQGGAPVSMFAYGNPSGFNPNSANKNTGFNPAMSPGMTATAFSGMQFGQLGPRLANSSSKMDPFGMNMNANFDPSKFNSIHMNFDMNSQLGIMGNPNGSPSGSQAFSGGYDPMKTNLMALQNPFTPGSANGNSSKTGMNQYGGGNNAFMKPFNPNALNEALFGKIENGPSNSTNGGSDGDFSSFYLGMGGGSGFGGSFDPSRVNNAVFNPDEVNKIRIHFDPSEMLERNPGYDKNVASTYNFDPNKVNQIQGQNVVPPFLGQNQGQSTPGSTDNKTKADSFGQPSEFHPGMLSGGGNQGIKFDPNKYNNITLQMNPMSQTNQIQSLINPANNSLSFDPTAVNNMQMNYNPYQMIGGNNLDHQLSTPGNNNQAPPSGQVQEFNTNHALPVNNVPTLQGGNKDDSA